MSYLKITQPNKIFFIHFFLVLFFIKPGLSQNEDSLRIPAEELIVDTLNNPILPNIFRSAIIPGYGQIMQERPGKAIIFYSIAMSLIYNGSYNYYWYNRTKNNKYKIRFRRFALLYSQLYLLNLLDVASTQIAGKNLKWRSEMFSDNPLKSPWGAAARSAMLPGWGQFYNEQYIKSVISFVIVADFIRKAIVYNQRYMDTRKKGFLERRTVNTWYAGLFYTLNMVDAFVDAYLYKFDETMELSVIIVPHRQTFSLGMRLNF